jgi:hypothetical protein
MVRSTCVQIEESDTVDLELEARYPLPITYAMATSENESRDTKTGVKIGWTRSTRH